MKLNGIKEGRNYKRGKLGNQIQNHVQHKVSRKEFQYVRK